MKEETEDKIELRLSPFERIVILNMLPQRASYHKGILIEQIKDKLSLDDGEISKYNVQYLENGNVIFGENGQALPEKEKPAFIDKRKFYFPKQKFNIIKSAFQKSDNENRLPVDPMVHKLYEKIVE